MKANRRAAADIPPEDMAEISAIAPLVHAMPYFQAEIHRMQAEVVRRALNLIANNELTGDVATQLWQEYAAQEKLLRKFSTRLKVSQGVASLHSSKLTETMNG